MTIFAWREWHVDQLDYSLAAVTRDDIRGIWNPGTNKATCLRFNRNPFSHWIERIPVKTCTCGFYARRYMDADSYSYGSHVFGVVELWGKVIPATYGYRAQFARPVALTASPFSGDDFGNFSNNLFELAARAYNIPLLPSASVAHQEYMV